MPPAFSIETARQRAEEAFRSPPSLARLARPKPKGRMIASFFLPLELLVRQNASRHQPIGVNAKVKERLYRMMWAQLSERRESALAGRPQVICTRFSSTEPDAYCDWAKMAIDLLCVPGGRRTRGLCFLRDDRPKDAEIVQRWEPAKRGYGFGVVEIFSGS